MHELFFSDDSLDYEDEDEDVDADAPPPKGKSRAKWSEEEVQYTQFIWELFCFRNVHFYFRITFFEWL